MVQDHNRKTSTFNWPFLLGARQPAIPFLQPIQANLGSAPPPRPQFGMGMVDDYAASQIDKVADRMEDKYNEQLRNASPLERKVIEKTVGRKVRGEIQKLRSKARDLRNKR